MGHIGLQGARAPSRIDAPFRRREQRWAHPPRRPLEGWHQLGARAEEERATVGAEQQHLLRVGVQIRFRARVRARVRVRVGVRRRRRLKRRHRLGSRGG